MRIPTQSNSTYRSIRSVNSIQVTNLIYPSVPKAPDGAKTGDNCRATREDGQETVAGKYECDNKGVCSCCTTRANGNHTCLQCNEIFDDFSTCENRASIFVPLPTDENMAGGTVGVFEGERPRPRIPHYIGGIGRVIGF